MELPNKSSSSSSTSSFPYATPSHESVPSSAHTKGVHPSTIVPDADHLDSYRKEIEISRARKLQLANRGPVGKKIVELAAHNGPVDIVELHNQYTTHSNVGDFRKGYTQDYGNETDEDQYALLQAAATISSPVPVNMMMDMGGPVPQNSYTANLVPIPLEMEIVNTNPSFLPPKEETATTTTTTTLLQNTNGPDPELLQEEINELRITVTELKDKLRQEMDEKLSLQGYLEREKSKNQTLKDRLTATEERCTLAENRVASLEAIVQGERNRATDEHSAYESLQRRFDAAEAAIQEYKKAIQHAEAEREHEMNRANGLEKRLQTALDGVKDLEAVIRRETEAKHANEIQMKALQDEIHRLEQKLRQETDQRISTETKLRHEMEARAKAEARIQAEMDARNRIEAEARARAEADALARAAAERAASETAKTVTELAYEETLAKLRSELLVKERELVRAHEIAHETNQQLMVTRDLLEKTRKMMEEERHKFQQSTADHEKERTKLNHMHEQERLRMVAEIEKLANKVSTTEGALEIMRKERNNALSTIEKEKQKYAQLTKDSQQQEKNLKDKIHELENEITSLQEELGMAKRRVVQLQQQQQSSGTDHNGKGHSVRKPARIKEVTSITLESVAQKKAQEAALEKEKRERVIIYPSLHTHIGTNITTSNHNGSGSTANDQHNVSSLSSAVVPPPWDNKPDLPSPPLTHVTIQEYHNEIANHRRIVADYEQKLERQIASANENKDLARKYREEVLSLRNEIDTTTEELLRMEGIAVTAGERLAEITHAYNVTQTMIQNLRNHINELEGGSCVHGLTFPGIPDAVVRKNNPLVTTTTSTVIHPKDATHSPHHHQQHRSLSASSTSSPSKARSMIATEGTSRSLSPVRVVTETIVPEVSVNADFHNFMNSLSSVPSPAKSSFVVGPVPTNTSTGSPRGRTQQRSSTKTNSLTSPKKNPVAFGSSSPRPGPNGKVESVNNRSSSSLTSSMGLGNIELASSLRSSSPSKRYVYMDGTTNTLSSSSMSPVTVYNVTAGGKRHASPEKSLIASVMHAGANNLLVPLPPAPVIQFTDSTDPSHHHHHHHRSPSSSLRPRTSDLSPQAKALIAIASGIPSDNNHYTDTTVPYHRSNSPMVKQLQELSAQTVLSSIAEIQAQDEKLRAENSLLKEELTLQLVSNKQQRKDDELRLFNETSSILAGNITHSITKNASLSSPNNSNDLRTFPEMTITPSTSPLPLNNNGGNNETVSRTDMRSPPLRNTFDVYSKALSIPSFSSSVNEHRSEMKDVEEDNTTTNNNPHPATMMNNTDQELARLFQDVLLQNTGNSSSPVVAGEHYPNVSSNSSSPSPPPHTVPSYTTSTTDTKGYPGNTTNGRHHSVSAKSTGTGTSSRAMYPGGVGTVIALASGHKSNGSTTSPTIVKGSSTKSAVASSQRKRNGPLSSFSSKSSSYASRHATNHVQPPPVPVDTSLITPLLDQGIGKEFVKAFHPSMGNHPLPSAHRTTTTTSGGAPLTNIYMNNHHHHPSSRSTSPLRTFSKGLPRTERTPIVTPSSSSTAVMLQDHQRTLVPTVTMSSSSSSTLLAAPDGHRPLVLVRPLSVSKQRGIGYYSSLSAVSSNSQSTIGSQPVGIPLTMI